MKDSSGSAGVLDLEVKEDNGELAVSVTDKGLPYLLTENQKKILGPEHSPEHSKGTGRLSATTI